MKKIVASVGLVALGASGIQTVSAQSISAPDTSKMWSVAATLRGFYDDNTATVPNNVTLPPGQERGSAGWEVSPSGTLNYALEQTTINLAALYSLKYYENTPPGSANHDDQVFTFNAGVNHSFSETLKVRVSDSFVIGQEPDLLRAGNTFATFQRISGDNIRNFGSIALDEQFTPKFGIGLGYDNAYYDYKASGVAYGDPVIVSTPAGLAVANPVIPSNSGLLDRIENRAHLEGLYTLQPETKLLLGYQFTGIGYTSDEPITGYQQFPDTQLTSSTRDSQGHTMYAGVTHDFSPQLSGALRAGATFTQYYNDPTASDNWTPYVNATLSYRYAPESSASIGFSYDRNPTDLAGLYNNGSFTLDAESGVIFASLSHRIFPNLFANVIGQFQNSTYYGGAYNNMKEQYYLAGLDVEYRFNPYFSAHAGYNFDRLASNSEINRSYDRNRVYVGITASY